MDSFIDVVYFFSGDNHERLLKISVRMSIIIQIHRSPENEKLAIYCVKY
jgi:hypothetical protein